MAVYSEWYPYTTSAGDTFDELALDAYDNELLASEIIAENPDYADVIVFDEGVLLYLPVIEEDTRPDTLPPWRDSE